MQKYNDYKPAKNINPFFEVTRSPLQTTVNNQTIDIPRHSLLNPNGELLGVVSEDYSLVTNKQVANLFDDFFNDYKISMVQDKMSHNGDRWIRDYILNDEEFIFEVKTGDIVKTKVSVMNGYNGGKSTGAIMAAWRQICANGMMGWSNILSIRLTHFNRNIINNLSKQINIKFKNIKKHFLTWQKWSEIEFKEKQFYSFIDNCNCISSLKARKIKELYPFIMNTYKEDETLWGAYNVLTAIGTHYSKSRNEDVASEFSNSYKVIEKVTKDFYKKYEKMEA